ncbi:hypothetical protein JCM9957A_24280 [Kineosporia succinea]
MNALPIDRHDEVLGTGLCVLVFRVQASPACAAFQPELEEFARRSPQIPVWTVEAMEEREVSERHHLRALPSIVVYREGLPCRRFAGAMSAGDLTEAVEEVAAADMAVEYNDWMLDLLETGETGSPHVGASTPAPHEQRAEVFPAPARPARAATEVLVPMTAGAPAVGVAQDAPTWDELYEEANDAWYAGDVPTALTGFTALLEMDPASLEIRLHRGQLLADNGGGALAVRELDRYLDEALDMFSIAYARSARALALAEAGRHEAADMDMAAALAVTPESAWAHLRLARIHLLRGDLSAMNGELGQARHLNDPPLTDAQRQLATALQRLA